MPKKGVGLGLFVDLMEGFGKKEGGGVKTPMLTMHTISFAYKILIYGIRQMIIYPVSKGVWRYHNLSEFSSWYIFKTAPAKYVTFLQSIGLLKTFLLQYGNRWTQIFVKA